MCVTCISLARALHARNADWPQPSLISGAQRPEQSVCAADLLSSVLIYLSSFIDLSSHLSFFISISFQSHFYLFPISLSSVSFHLYLFLFSSFSLSLSLSSSLSPLISLLFVSFLFFSSLSLFSFLPSLSHHISVSLLNDYHR